MQFKAIPRTRSYLQQEQCELSCTSKGEFSSIHSTVKYKYRSVEPWTKQLKLVPVHRWTDFITKVITLHLFWGKQIATLRKKPIKNLFTSCCNILLFTLILRGLFLYLGTHSWVQQGHTCTHCGYKNHKSVEFCVRQTSWNGPDTQRYFAGTVACSSISENISLFCGFSPCYWLQDIRWCCRTPSCHSCFLFRGPFCC